jgi:hypothetical protein
MKWESIHLDQCGVRRKLTRCDGYDGDEHCSTFLEKIEAKIKDYNTLKEGYEACIKDLMSQQQNNRNSTSSTAGAQTPIDTTKCSIFTTGFDHNGLAWQNDTGHDWLPPSDISRLLYLQLPPSCTACRSTKVTQFVETDHNVTVTFSQPGIRKGNPMDDGQLSRTLVLGKYTYDAVTGEISGHQRGHTKLIAKLKRYTLNGTYPYEFKCNIIGGYEGRMCSKCLPGYYKNMDKICSQCFPLWQSALIASGLFIGGMLALTIFVFVVMSDAGSTSTAGSVQKILLNHFQLISSCIMYPLKWPPMLKSAFEVQGALSALGERVISVDCMLNTDVLPTLNPFYLKQLIFAFLPIFAMAAAAFIMLVHKCCVECRRKRKPLHLDMQSVNEKVKKRHEARKNEVKSMFKMASHMAAISGSKPNDETMADKQSGFNMKRMKSTMGLKMKKESVRKNSEKTKALTEELLSYAGNGHGKSKLEQVERHAIATMRARQFMEYIHHMSIDMAGIFQKYDTKMTGAVTTGAWCDDE